MTRTNRDQRRKLKKAHIELPPETLREYLDQPELVVRRGELWEILWRSIWLYDLDRRNKQPWRRLVRWMHGLFSKKEATVDPETGEESPNDG